MRLAILAAAASCAALTGCAVFTSSPRIVPDAVMHSPPPERRAETAPRLERAQAWVPGYFEPIAGAWIWHPGLVVAGRPGYRVVAAYYSELGGEFRVSRPHWESVRIANRQ